MKKVVLSLVFAALLMPFSLQAQTKGLPVVQVDKVACDSFHWNVNGVDYNQDTIVLYTANDTAFILNLTINHSVSVSDAVEGECSYSWNGTVYDNAGVYVDTLKTAENCDSVVTLTLTLSKIHRDTLAPISWCGNYDWHGNTYDESGTYSDTVHVAATNCDSIYFLPLDLVEVFRTVETVEHCGAYTWRDSSYTVSTIDSVLVTDELGNGCDSMFVLDLDIVVNHDTTTMTACMQYRWTVSNETYTESGMYIDSVGNDCITEKVLDLTVLSVETVSSDTTAAACERVRWKFAGGTQFYVYSDSTATKTFQYRTAANCKDSTSVVHFLVYQPYRDTVEIAGCDYAVWELKNNKEYDHSQTDTVKLGFTVNHCDSAAVALITVNPSPVVNAIQGTLHVEAGEPITLYVDEYDDALTYEWSYNYGAPIVSDTLVISEGIQENTDVNLRAINSETECEANIWITVLVGVGIEDVEGVEVNLYPNPAHRVLNVASSEAIEQAMVFNAAGQAVSQFDNLGVNGALNLSALSNGTYTLRLVLENGKSIIRKFVVVK